MKLDGIKVLLNVNHNLDYNLTEIYRSGNDRKLLKPIEWLKLDSTQNDIKLVYDELDGLVRVLSSAYPVIYVRSRYIWLLYLRYCIGNDISQAIQSEVSDLLPDGAA